MSDDQNTTTKNPISEETTPKDGQNSLPTSPQEPTEPIPVNSTDLGDSHPSVPVEELGADGGNLKEVEYDNIPPPEGFEGEHTPLPAEKPLESPDFTHIEPEKEPKIPLEPTDPQPNPASNGTGISEPEPQTPQIPVNEPLPESEPSVSEAKEEPKTIETPEPEPEKEKPRISYLKSQKWSELLVMARNAIQFRKRKKLGRVMTLFLKQSKITNDEVEKFLHVSDATATRYLSQLEKEGKIKQSGKIGKGVSYSRI